MLLSRETQLEIARVIDTPEATHPLPRREIETIDGRAGGLLRELNPRRPHVGVTPKRVARIYRFARLILSVDARRPVDWPGLAHTAGYFDQAHFSREFKDFTGHTPAQYLALRRRFPAEPGFLPDSGPMPAD